MTVLPYPWQHPKFDDMDFPNACERVRYCLTRVQEAKRNSSEAVSRAWESEAVLHAPALLEEIKLMPETTESSQLVLRLVERHKTTWRDKDDNYWLQRLMQEVGELASTLAGDHEGPKEWELKQIAAICINWLDKLDDA